MTVLLSAMIGPLFLGGLAAVAVAWRMPAAAPAPVLPRRLGALVPAQWTPRLWLHVALGTGAALVVMVGTGWPVAALLAGAAGAAVPTLAGGRARRAAAIARIEAIASWTEQLRDMMSAAEGIQGAITATAPVAPPAIASEVRVLVERLSVHRERLRPSLVAFAEDLSHPLGDMVVAALLLAAEHRGSPVDLLAEVAASARRTASMRLEVEATRAQTYVTTRLILILTVAMVAWLVLVQRQYMAPYATAAGQLMLGVIGAVFAVAGWRLHRMARPTEPARLLIGNLQEEPAR